MVTPLTNTRYEITVAAVRTKPDSVTYQDRAEIFKLSLSSVDIGKLMTFLTSYQFKEAEQLPGDNGA